MIDYVNATFELLGAVVAWTNVRRLLHDRQVKGIHWATVGFFGLWGYWNLIYYPALDQWFSAVAGCGLALANTVWVVLAVRFMREAK